MWGLIPAVLGNLLSRDLLFSYFIKQNKKLNSFREVEKQTIH